MTKDYKPGPEKKPTPAPGWVWLLAGLLLGLFAGFLIYLSNAVPISEKKITSNQAEAKLQPPPKKEQESILEENEASRFSFYRELPRMVIEVPIQEAEDEAEQPPKTNRPIAVNKTKIETLPSPPITKSSPAQSTYILQVGSFRDASEAERLKARLAFMGLQAKVQPVTVNKHQRWIRVRVGPFPSFKQAEQIQARLKRNKITAILLKLSS